VVNCVSYSVAALQVFPRETPCYNCAGTGYGPVSVCLSVSVTSRCSVETVGRIKLGFGTKVFFGQSYAVSRKFRYLQNKGTSLGNFATNSGLFSPRHIDCRNVLSTKLKKGGRSQRDKLDRRRSTKLTIPLSSDARPL